MAFANNLIDGGQLSTKNGFKTWFGFTWCRWGLALHWPLSIKLLVNPSVHIRPRLKCVFRRACLHREVIDVCCHVCRSSVAGEPRGTARGQYKTVNQEEEGGRWVCLLLLLLLLLLCAEQFGRWSLSGVSIFN